MRARSKYRKHMMSEINVVPYVDVMLVLLVIFMITAPLLSQGVKIHLPQAEAKALTVKRHLPIIVTVDEKGQYYLNIADHPNQPMTSRQLVNRIAAEIVLAKQDDEKRTVLVRGDKDVPYGKVVYAMVLLQQAGVVQVGLMTQSPDQNAVGNG